MSALAGTDQNSTPLTLIADVFYKHVLLHGLNITVALAPARIDVTGHWFQLYWVLLNTAYVMEFFLQTLVRKRYLLQQFMLGFNQALMILSTLPALSVALSVFPEAALLSFFYNMFDRGNDLVGTLQVTAMTIGIRWYIGGSIEPFAQDHGL